MTSVVAHPDGTVISTNAPASTVSARFYYDGPPQPRLQPPTYTDKRSSIINTRCGSRTTRANVSMPGAAIRVRLPTGGALSSVYNLRTCSAHPRACLCAGHDYHNSMRVPFSIEDSTEMGVSALQLADAGLRLHPMARKPALDAPDGAESTYTS